MNREGIEFTVLTFVSPSIYTLLSFLHVANKILIKLQVFSFLCVLIPFFCLIYVYLYSIFFLILCVRIPFFSLSRVIFVYMFACYVDLWDMKLEIRVFRFWFLLEILVLFLWKFLDSDRSLLSLCFMYWFKRFCDQCFNTV